MVLENLQIIDKFFEAERALDEVKHYFHMSHKLYGRLKTFDFDEMANKNIYLLHISLHSKFESLYDSVTNFFENKLSEQEIKENNRPQENAFCQIAWDFMPKKQNY